MMINWQWINNYAMQGFLTLIILIIALFLWRAQKRLDFDLIDLLMENGRVSKIACTFMATFALTSWVIIHLTLKGNLTEGYLSIYGAFWVAPLVAKVIFNKQTAESEKTTPIT